MRILIAEDDEALARFVRQGLEAEHYAVDVVADGEQARATAIERFGHNRDRFRPSLRPSARERSCGGVQEHDIAPRAAFPGEDLAQELGILWWRPAAELIQGRVTQTELLRLELADWSDAAVM